MSGIILFMSFQLSGSICNYLTSLHKHTVKSNSENIGVDYETLATLGRSQNGSVHWLILQSLKIYLTFISPYKWNTLLSKSNHRLCNKGRTLYKMSVTASESKKTPNFGYIGRSLPFRCLLTLRKGKRIQEHTTFLLILYQPIIRHSLWLVLKPRH